MAYCTETNVRTRLPALPADTVDADVDAAIADGIEYADGQIDSCLASRYSVPFNPVPSLIKHISADLATAFTLDACFSGGGEDEETSLSDTIRSRAEKLLERLCDEDDSLVLPGLEEDGEANFTAFHSNYGNTLALESFDLVNPPSSSSTTAASA